MQLNIDYNFIQMKFFLSVATKRINKRNVGAKNRHNFSHKIKIFRYDKHR